MSSTKTCFIIMPFGEKVDAAGQHINFDHVYKYIITPPLKKLGLDVVRCDEIPNPGSIHRDMLSHIRYDDLAIVDITTLNPNVFYELGVRHALRPSGTILLRRKGTQSPFNIQGMRTFEYDVDLESAAVAQTKLTEVIQHALNNRGTDSLVHDVFPDLTPALAIARK